MAAGDYTVQLYTRAGIALGEVPCTWTATLGLRRVNSLSIEGRAEDPIVAKACLPLERVLVLSEEDQYGGSTFRLCAEVVDFERVRDANGKGTVKITALSPEWRWWSTLIGNLSQMGGPVGSTLLNMYDGTSKPWVAPVGTNAVNPVLNWLDDAPAIDRATAAWRLVSHAAAAGYDLAVGGATHSGAQAAGLRLPPPYGGSMHVHDCGIRAGGYTVAGSNISTAVPELSRKTVGQMMDELAGGIDGFDWWINYTKYPNPEVGKMVRAAYNGATFDQWPGRRLTAIWGDWQAAPVKGETKKSVVYEYGAGNANVETFSERVTGQAVGTAATVPGLNGLEGEASTMDNPSAGDKGAAYSYDHANAAKYGLLDRLVTPSIASYGLRKQLADDAIAIGSKPQQTITITPSQKANAGKAWPLRDYAVGDRIRFVAWERVEATAGTAPAVPWGPNLTTQSENFVAGIQGWTAFPADGSSPIAHNPAGKGSMQMVVTPTAAGHNASPYPDAAGLSYKPSIGLRESVKLGYTARLAKGGTSGNINARLYVRCFDESGRYLGQYLAKNQTLMVDGTDVRLEAIVTRDDIRASSAALAGTSRVGLGPNFIATLGSGTYTIDITDPLCQVGLNVPVGDALSGRKVTTQPVATFNAYVRVYGVTLAGGVNKETTATVVLSET